ncbi:MAG TPA: hypothetical protein VIP11_22015 [Gemmatimonadaceae bacterium]
MTTMSTFNTHGKPLPDVRLTLHESQIAGIALGADRGDLMPGETATVPHSIAVQLLASGRARLASEDVPASPISPDPADISTPEGGADIETQESGTVPATPDPTDVTVNRPAPRRRR